MVVDGALIKKLAKSTGLPELRLLAQQNKEQYVLKKDLIEIVRTRIMKQKESIQSARESKKTNSGRNRLPDPTKEEFEALSPSEQLKVKNRIWQRQSRFNRKITKKP